MPQSRGVAYGQCGTIQRAQSGLNPGRAVAHPWREAAPLPRVIERRFFTCIVTAAYCTPMRHSPSSPAWFRVQARDREPLIEFMIQALRSSGCRIIHRPRADIAPFRITFETPGGERLGIIAYAFLATFTPTKNRPDDEHSFQVKYGSKDGKLHQLWQDPYGLYTTLFLGINPELDLFVAADPVVHNPTKFFIRVEFKQEHVDEILRRKWHAWERRKVQHSEPVEVLVGGTADSFLRLIRFEREVLGEAPGHRQLLAERALDPSSQIVLPSTAAPIPGDVRLHQLAREFELDEHEVLNLIAGTRRLKMAVRGWVAEEHLVRHLRDVRGVSECNRSDAEGGPDVLLRYQRGPLIRLECKNVLRDRAANGDARVDFQRTRSSKNNPCSRFYSADDFEVVAACLHAVSERWEFRFAPTSLLDPHKKCAGKLSNLVRVDQRWQAPIEDVLRVASGL